MSTSLILTVGVTLHISYEVGGGGFPGSFGSSLFISSMNQVMKRYIFYSCVCVCYRA